MHASTVATPTTNATLLNDTIDYPIQLVKLREAIASQLKEHQQKDLTDLVDMIQSLKKRDLSLCLFNSSFLKQKIEEAYDALYLFQNSDLPVVPHTAEFNSATAILNSLEGLTPNKKKRVFGDIFYPYVKAS